MIRITAMQDGFRRCGMAHPKEATEHPDGTFSDEQIKKLQAEPLLAVEIVQEQEMTVQDIKDLLDEMKVDYPAGAKKAELKAILDAIKEKKEKSE
ncbi:hypothetical protein Dvar_68300 [Desulfosarcina variabilis str. Montpellier]